MEFAVVCGGWRLFAVVCPEFPEGWPKEGKDGEKGGVCGCWGSWRVAPQRFGERREVDQMGRQSEGELTVVYCPSFAKASEENLLTSSFAVPATKDRVAERLLREGLRKTRNTQKIRRICTTEIWRTQRWPTEDAEGTERGEAEMWVEQSRRFAPPSFASIIRYASFAKVKRPGATKDRLRAMEDRQRLEKRRGWV